MFVSRSADCRSRRCGPRRSNWDWLWPTSPTARTSASSRRGDTQLSSTDCAQAPTARAISCISTAGYSGGKRRGLNVAVGDPLYVLRLDPARRQVVVGPREALLSAALVLTEIN